MPFATHEQALAFWFGLINYEQKVSLPGDFKLEHTRALLRLLGDPQERVPTVHVAGTKGKGSTSAMLAAILQRAGYRTGLFTSPHLNSVQERIQVNGSPIEPDELTTLLSEVADAIGYEGKQCRLLEAPTFFEVAVGLGWLHFLRRGVDVAVVEVGLGGRYDSTNVCRTEAAVLTSISFDHTRQLGNTLASIAASKAGIFAAGRPAVSGAEADEARGVIEQVARERGALLRQLGRDFFFTHIPAVVTSSGTKLSRVRVTTQARSWPELELHLLGEHQAANAAVAVATVEELRQRGWQIPDSAVSAGLAEVAWPARLEVVQRRPLVVLDCAHNLASAQALVETLTNSFPPGRRLLIFAGSTDKDLPGMLRLLGPHFQHAWLTRYTNNPRSADPEQLAGWLRQGCDIAVTRSRTPAEAWQEARSAAGPDDLLCVTGSVFLAGELRPLMLQQGPVPLGSGP